MYNPSLKVIEIIDWVCYFFFVGALIGASFFSPLLDSGSPVFENDRDFRFLAKYLLIGITFYSWFHKVLVFVTVFVWSIAYTEAY